MSLERGVLIGALLMLILGSATRLGRLKQKRRPTSTTVPIHGCAPCGSQDGSFPVGTAEFTTVTMVIGLDAGSCQHVCPNATREPSRDGHRHAGAGAGGLKQDLRGPRCANCQSVLTAFRCGRVRATAQSRDPTECTSPPAAQTGQARILSPAAPATASRTSRSPTEPLA
jgi:hypothetical protein